MATSSEQKCFHPSVVGGGRDGDRDVPGTAPLMRPSAQVSQEVQRKEQGSQVGRAERSGPEGDPWTATGHFRSGPGAWAVEVAYPRVIQKSGGQLLLDPHSLHHVTHFSITSKSVNSLSILCFGPGKANVHSHWNASFGSLQSGFSTHWETV